MTLCGTFHFLNVGRGDCIIIQHHLSSRVTMVDINNGTDIEDFEFDEIVNSVQAAAIRDAAFATTARQAAHLESLGQSHRKAWKSALQPYWSAILKRSGYELQNPIEYLAALGITNIFRLVVTHPDSDHFTGLHMLDDLMQKGQLTISNFWHIADAKTIDSFESDEEKESWQTYQKWKSQPFNRAFQKDALNQYFNQDDAGGVGDGIYVLSPDSDLLTDAKSRFATKSDIYNNASFILLVLCGGARIVLGGDAFGNRGSTPPADEPNNNYMPNAWRHVLNTTHYGHPASAVLRGVTILKASHHGLESGYHDEAVPLMNPRIAIISEGPKGDADAQHLYPNETMSTRFYGNIVADVYDTGEVLVWTQKSRPDKGSLDTRNKQGYYLNSKSVTKK